METGSTFVAVQEMSEDAAAARCHATRGAGPRGPKCLELNLHGHFISRSDPSGPRNCSLAYRNPEEGGTTPPPLALSYS